ncbi:hypothetical protein BDV3_000961 [Batrachochytrium dendrobatidis]
MDTAINRVLDSVEILLPVQSNIPSIEARILERDQDNHSIQLRKALAASKFDTVHKSSYRRRVSGSALSSHYPHFETGSTISPSIDASTSSTPSHGVALKQTIARSGPELGSNMPFKPLFPSHAQSQLDNTPLRYRQPTKIATMDEPNAQVQLNSSATPSPSQQSLTSDTTSHIDSSPTTVHLSKEQQRKIFQALKKKIKSLQTELDAVKTESRSQLDYSNNQIRTLQEIIESKQHRLKVQASLGSLSNTGGANASCKDSDNPSPKHKQVLPETTDAYTFSLNATVKTLSTHISQQAAEIDRLTSTITSSTIHCNPASTGNIAHSINSLELQEKRLQNTICNTTNKMADCLALVFPEHNFNPVPSDSISRIEFVVSGFEALQAKMDQMESSYKVYLERHRLEQIESNLVDDNHIQSIDLNADRKKREIGQLKLTRDTHESIARAVEQGLYVTPSKTVLSTPRPQSISISMQTAYSTHQEIQPKMIDDALPNTDNPLADRWSSILRTLEHRRSKRNSAQGNRRLEPDSV